jgi:hypothetical protein
MQQLSSDPGLLHGFLFSQLVRNKAADRYTTGKTEYHMLACYAQAVKYINSRMGHTQTACDDLNILAVSLLAYSGKVNPRNEPGAGPTQGPLKSLQLLDFYGGIIDSDSTHERGLTRMIELRGGIDHVEVPGLAQMLS